MSPVHLDRRHCLAAAAATGATALVASVATPAAAAPGPTGRATWSTHGWPVLGDPVARVVEGSDLTLVTAAGAPAVVLGHLVRRWFYEIDDSVRPSELVSHVPLRRGATATERLHATGIAVAIRPGWFPPGSAERLAARDVLVVRDILAELRGVVRWGADSTPHDDARFVLDLPPLHPDLDDLVRRLRPSAKSGPDLVSADLGLPFTPARQAVARATARAQHARHP